ncbi:MAG: DUF763 domain-containing protein, partial [Candidatus Parvarchaeota archaeon]
IVTIIVDEYGCGEFLKRLSDPFWFQALGCVLGYDWHSSGVTTVVTGVLKQAIIPEEHGIAVCGGKGKISRQTPTEIEIIGEIFGFSESKIEQLKYASRMSAKVDNAAIQAGYQLYHHTLFMDEKGRWVIIQQGMCKQDRTARRYHWLSEGLKSFIIEPHTAIVGDVKRRIALDMTAKESEGCRRASVDLACEPPRKLMKLTMSLRAVNQKSLLEWIPGGVEMKGCEAPLEVLSMPRTINWNMLKELYEFKPQNYEELLSFKGVGAATVRGLALIAELIYGEKPSWRDPVKFSFAYGGKDGVPYPVNKRAMDESIQILRKAVEEAKIGDRDKLRAINRLRALIPDVK